jgi:hypothetical protein
MALTFLPRERSVERRRVRVAIYPAIAVPDGERGSPDTSLLCLIAPSHDGHGRRSRPARSTLSSKPFFTLNEVFVRAAGLLAVFIEAGGGAANTGL